jgi:tetratricopeptide (TPR) repeat protein
MMHRALVLFLVVVGAGGGAVYWLVARSGPQSQFPDVDRALAERRFQDASRLLKSYLSKNPDDMPALFLAAQTSRRENVLIDASDYLQTYEKLNGSKDAIVLERQLARLQSGDLRDAPKLLLNCESRPDAAETPMIVEAYLMAVERYFNMTPNQPGMGKDTPPDLPKALWAAGLWLAKRPSRADQLFGLLLRGNIHKSLEHHAEAIADLRKAVELDEENVPARFSLAILIAQAEPRESIEHLRFVLSRNPEDIKVLTMLAAGLRGLGRFDESRQLYDTLLQRDPNNPQFWLGRGNMALDCLDYQEADYCLRKAEKMAPNEPTVLNSIYRLLVLKGDADEARKYRERFLRAETAAGANQKPDLTSPIKKK